MTELAEAIASLVGPYLPMLLARGETLLEEAEITIAPDLRKRAQAVWDRLNPSVSARPSAESAARLVAESPEDESARAAFKLQIEDILHGDSTLAEEVRELVATEPSGELESVADAAMMVRDAIASTGADEYVLRVVDADLAILVDEASRPSPSGSIVDSRLRALAVISSGGTDEERRRVIDALARLGNTLRAAER
jgi:hypothetical protein